MESSGAMGDNALEGPIASETPFRLGDRMNKVVARFLDGRLVKGMTADFVPTKDIFHVTPAVAPPGTKPVEIRLSDLKALFFVKDFGGDPDYTERKEFDPSRPVAGRRIRVVFEDGEVLVGVTQGYQPGRPGFFLEPADPRSNNDRCYVVTAATRTVAFI
jgi:hypothetical protein